MAQAEHVAARPVNFPLDLIPSDQLRPRQVEPEDWLRFERSMAEIFAAFGMDLETPATERTPERFLKALYDATDGYEGDHKLLTAFPTECRCDDDCLVSQIIEGPIPFYSLCEHHALPFHGFAHVGYIAHERMIGISKLTRLVRLFARRFTLQERLGEEIGARNMDCPGTSTSLLRALRPHTQPACWAEHLASRCPRARAARNAGASAIAPSRGHGAGTSVASVRGDRPRCDERSARPDRARWP
jgi:GTP cyclohydrolase I